MEGYGRVTRAILTGHRLAKADDRQKVHETPQCRGFHRLPLGRSQ